MAGCLYITAPPVGWFRRFYLSMNELMGLSNTLCSPWVLLWHHMFALQCRRIDTHHTKHEVNTVPSSGWDEGLHSYK